MSTEQDLTPDTSDKGASHSGKARLSIQNFFAGIFLSGIPMVMYVYMSIWMTHTTWTDISVWKLGIAILLPIGCGLLAVVQGDRFLKILESILDTNVPF